MPLELSTYVDPGVYIGEVAVPGNVNIATVPLLLGIIAPGSRQKKITNEAIQRGLVEGAVLTFSNVSGTAVSGTDSITAPVSGVQTLTIAAGAFTPLVIGSTITIRGDTTNPQNNGTFPVVDVPGGTQIAYTNLGGAATAAFGGTYAVKPHAIVIGGTGTPTRTNRALQNTIVYRDAKALSDSFLNFRPAHLLSTVAIAGTVDLTVGATLTTPAMVLELDGHVPLTLIFTASAGATTVQGTEVTVKASKIAALATASLAEIVAAVNEGLNPTDATANAAVTALGYGAAYANAASEVTGSSFLRIVSPTSGPSSDVRASSAIDESVTAVIMGAPAAANRDAQSVMEMERVVYSSSSVYTIDFIDINDTADDLANTGVLEVSRVGSAAGISNYEENVDFALGTDALDWSLGVSASYTGTNAATYNLTTNDTIRVSIDGGAFVQLDLNASAVAPTLGYANPAAPGAATADEVVANINALLAANANYGSRYQSVASKLTVGGSDYVVLTSPTTGPASSVTFAAPTSLDAASAIFGIAASQLPLSRTGTGKEPTAASVYFATYEITRPDADYNIQKQFLSEAQAKADLGTANAQNPLMVAVNLAFRQRVNAVVVVQVDDSNLPGTPTRQEILDALEATTNSDLITDVAVISTDLATRIDLKDHIESESSPLNKHYRRGWFGMALDTDPGDRDTPDTFVYTATRTLQVTPESPGRGRMILVAPPQREGVSVDLTQDNGSVERVTLDSSYLAVMAAAKKASFTSPAASLAKQTISGLNVDDISLSSIWKPAERRTMASQGVMVVTYDAGNFKILDPCTTEVGGGGLAAFSYPSCSTQKDNITRKVDRALDANIVGVVPTDLIDFIIDIKIFISDVISGEIGARSIGPYRNKNGTTRRIDLTTDIEVEQDQNDPTKFFFKYWYNLRYPALRLLGEFSVDNPFFTTAQAA